MAVSTAPSFNKTPVGASTPPLPYPTVQDLGASVGTTASVRLNGEPGYVLDQSTQPRCRGDDAGSAGGVRSGTVNGEVKPVRGSTTVRFEGHAVIRAGDPNTMNGGNNPGIYVTQPAPASHPPRVAAGVEPAPDPAPGWLERAARHYKERVSPAAHDVAGQALDRGGTLTAAGTAVGAAGGAMIATGIGAGPGAIVTAAGAATAAVGAGVGAVGGVTEAAASALDQAVEYVLTGKHPDLLGVALALGQQLVLDRITRFVPGSKVMAKTGTAGHSGLPSLPGGGGDGLSVVGRGHDPCGVRPYKEQKCPAGQQAHHIVPDYTLRYGTRREGTRGQERIPGMPKFDDGPTICLTGASRSAGGEHNQSHKGTDERIRAAGERSDNGMRGLAPVGEIVEIAIEEVTKLKPHCGAEIERKVGEAFKHVDRSQYGRTTQQPPKAGSETRAALEAGAAHTDSGRVISRKAARR